MASLPARVPSADPSAVGHDPPDLLDPLEWPASPWPASAPESYLLLHFSKPDAKHALKLAVLELVARGWLQLIEVQKSGAFGRKSKDSVLSWGKRASAGGSLPPALEPLWQVFDELVARSFTPWPGAGGFVPLPESERHLTSPDPSSLGTRGRARAIVHRPLHRRSARSLTVSGAEVKRFAVGVVREFGSVDGYVTKVVRPALVDRSWVVGERYRVLGIFPATRWVLTAEGVAAQGDLLWRVDYGNRELGRLVDDAPERAIAFAGLAGAALLLMDDARPHLQRLRRRLEEGIRAGQAAPAGGVTYIPGDVGIGAAALETGALADGLDTGALDAAGIDLGGLDAGLAGLDLSAFDSIDGAFSAIDGGVDAGASGADGGAGGGGDGGDGGDGGGDGGGGGD